ncbi:MAG TPA: M1 family metallopeptidase, partial [Isosphaeraceae bacterium]
DLTVDFARKELRGTATLVVERAPGVPAAAPLVLDTRGLHIEAAEAATADGPWGAAAFELGPDEPIRGAPLAIALPGGATRARVAYRTAPGAGALQWLEPAQTAGGRAPFLFTQSQAILARTWIPLQDSPAVRVTYAATIRVPEGLTALMAADGAGGEPGVFRFEMPEPIPPYLIALAVGELAFHPLGPRTGVYAEPSVLDRAAWELADAERMLAAAEARCGPYRWGRYDLLVLPPSFPFGGMENPKLTFATPTILAGDRSLVSLVAHELAHSWSGNLVTNATWRDFWLNEGVTTYLERRIIEDLYGPDRAAMEAVLGLQELRAELPTHPPAEQVLHIDLAGRDPDEGMTQVPYEKGALLLTTLERAAGRPRFDAFLRGYFDRFAFRSLTTADFARDVQQHLPGAIAAAELDAWLHAPGLPPIAEPTSARFAAVDRQSRRWRAGEVAPGGLATADWSTHEWLHFLRGLPEDLPAARLAELDAAFHLTDRPNAEIAQQWLLLALRAGYAPADARLETFLTTIGRRKYLVPLYTELIKTPAGRDRARAIFAKARPFYHPIAADSVEKLLRESE